MNEMSQLKLNGNRKCLTEKDNLLLELICLTSNMNSGISVLQEMARRRRQLLLNIMSAHIERINTIYKTIIFGKVSRRVFTKRRRGNFWEEYISRSDETFFKECFRMSRNSFKTLCEKLSDMARMNTNYRACIPMDKRIAIALYSLKSSVNYGKIGRLFSVSESSVCQILKEFCLTVWQILGPEYLSSTILTPEKVVECVAEFEIIGFPQCFGAIGGCHMEIRPNSEESFDYYNYKGWYSMVLLALVDYKSRFLYVNVGAPGCCNYSQIFEKSTLKKILEKPNALKENTKLINGVNVPVVILGDSAFHISNYLMKPFSLSAEENEINFNHCLSKARKVVTENAFRHLKARFGRIGKGIDNDIKNCTAIIKCCCVLQNFLIEHNDQMNERFIQAQNQWERSRGRVQPVYSEILDSHDQEAEEMRNAISTYLSNYMVFIYL